MTSGEEKKLDAIAQDLGEIKIAVAVLAEKASHAVDETTVVRIVKGALSEHLANCRALNADADLTKGINPALIKALVIVATAAAGAIGGANWL